MVLAHFTRGALYTYPWNFRMHGVQHLSITETQFKTILSVVLFHSSYIVPDHFWVKIINFYLNILSFLSPVYILPILEVQSWVVCWLGEDSLVYCWTLESAKSGSI